MRMVKIDFDARIRKALSDDNAGTVLMQPNVNTIIADIVDYENAFRQNLSRLPGSGDSAIVNRRVPGTTAAAFVSDTATTFNQDDGAYTQVVSQFKTILARGAVSRRLIAQGRSYVDVKTREIESRAKDYRNFEDNALLDSTVTTLAYDGIKTLVTNISSPATTNAGLVLTLPMLDAAIDEANGRIDMMVMSRRSRREISALRLGNTTQVEVQGGFKLPSYSEIPIYVSTNIPNTQRLNLAATAVANDTSGNTTSIYFINNEELWVEELVPIEMRDVNPVSSNVENFEIFSDHVPVIRDTLSCVALIGIAPAS